MRSSRLLAVVMSLIALASLSTLAQGEQANGVLRITVLEKGGVCLPGATVTVRSSAGTSFTGVANVDGAVTFSDLAPGQYAVEISFPDYLAFRRAEVRVQAGDVTSLTAHLIEKPPTTLCSPPAAS